ncbi:MAG: hypothetical protein QM775_08675 [Pirellulales bacterium]
MEPRRLSTLRTAGRSAALALAMIVAVGTSGCTSIRSTFLTRDAANAGWERHCHLDGIPITLKVPTHIKLYVFDKHYLELVTMPDNSKQIVPIELDVPVRDFAQEFLFTEKIFTVDFKRPAAGSANLRLEMTDEQYFNKIQHDVTDDTIAKVNDLMKKFTPAGRSIFGMAASAEAGAAPKVKEVKSLVAVGLFDVDAPDLEQQLMNFLNCHINKSHDAWVVPHSVNHIHRVPVSGNLNVPYPGVPFCPECPIGPPPPY